MLAFFMGLNDLNHSQRTNSIVKETLKHIIAVIIALAFTYSFGWIVKNWESKFVIEGVHITSRYLGANLFWIKPTLVIVLIISFHVIMRVIERFRQGRMSAASGMFFYSPNHNNRKIKKGKKFLKEKSSKCTHIYTMGATGWDTFGRNDSPLHESLKSCHETQIILLSPISDELKQRANDVKQNENKYRNEICKSINYLTTLRARGANPKRIHLKFYSTYPGWKYIFIEPYVWVQYYSPDGHIMNMPVYMYEDVPKGIYSSLLDHFFKRWVSHWLWPYNFETKEIEYVDKNGKIYKRKSIEQLLINATR